MTPKIALIAAVAENGVIGRDQDIPWRIPSDFAWFRRATMGKPMVMGRRQYETVGRPLPGRANIVLSRRPGFAPEGVIVVPDLEAALARADEIARAEGAEEVMVIGGGEVYRQTIGRADRLYISHVALAPEGDVLFPPIDPAVWTVVGRPEVVPSARDEAVYDIRIYERR